MKRTLALSINTSWNLVNFRSNLIRRFQREGYDVVAISPEDGYGAALEQMGVHHIPLAIDSKGLSPLQDVKLMTRYWSILGELRPAAYLGWTIKPNIYGSLAAHLRGVPVINNISGLGTAFIKEGIVTQIAQALYKAALKRSSTIFFQNPHDRALFLDQSLVREQATALLAGSGIDLTHFDPGPNSFTDIDPPVFLMVARLLRDKGVGEFAEAAAIVRSRRPDVEFRLLGFLDVPNRTAISRNVVEQWEQMGTLRYLGETNDVREHLVQATAVVLPSYREGMPRSLLEAAAMGRPLIATDVPGCTEIALEGQNAFLCEPRNASSLAEAIVAMLGCTVAERRAMGTASRHLAESKFDVRLIEDRYMEAITTAIAD